jgi:DNA helicase-2/ATP-dependent DNA helicase PcrA
LNHVHQSLSFLLTFEIFFDSQGDRHVYASRTRFIPDQLLALFERTTWPVAAAGIAARTASQGPCIDVGARMRGMWR